MHLSFLCRLWNHLLCYVTDSIANLCICHCCVACEIIFCVMLLIRLLIYASVIVVSSVKSSFVLCYWFDCQSMHLSFLCRLWNHILCYVTDSIANLCICHCCVVCEIIFCVTLLIRLLIYASVIVVSSVKSTFVFCYWFDC